MYCRKEYGLPRRFAPRNDRLKAGSCARLQERPRNDMQKHAAVRMSNYVLPGQIRSFYEFA